MTVPAPTPRSHSDPDAAPTIALAGGGTGGHIFPLLATWEALAPHLPDHEPLFLCSDRPIDARVLGPTGRPFAALPARPFSLKPLPLAKLVLGWGPALRAARARLRGCRAVVTTGGFVAAPVAQAAQVEGVPLVLVNLDAVPGKASAFVARRAAAVATAAEGPRTPAGWARLRPIVRADARFAGDRAAARVAMGLDPDRPVLLVTGGSQGARTINDLLAAFAAAEPDALRGWHVLHQCGPGPEARERVATLTNAYGSAGASADVRPLFEGSAMGTAWAAADAAVARAGAGSVAEAWAARCPTLFLPYPFHKDEHQRLNAERLTVAGAADLARDRIDPAANLAGEAGAALRTLVGSEEHRTRRRLALAQLGPADGAERAAELVLRVLDEHAGARR